MPSLSPSSDLLSSDDTICALEECSFSDEAAHGVVQHVPGTRVRNVPSIAQVWNGIEQGDVGLVPIENSSGGIVWPHLHELRRGAYRIVGQVNHPVRMCVGAPAGVHVAQAKTVCSHHKALDQSRDWLSRHPHLQQNAQFHSTVDAVRFAAECPQALAIAMGTRMAIEKHGLSLVEEDVADIPAEHNITRMFLLRNNGHHELPDPERIHHAMVAKLENYDGSLHDALGVVRQAAGLSCIQSRNIGHMRYEFFLQMMKRHAATPESADRFRRMVDALHALVGRENIRWLGSWDHSIDTAQS